MLALKLFDDYNNHISARILLEAQKPHVYVINFDNVSLFDGLHCASIFGIDEIVANLVEVEDCDINQGDCCGNTPLAWAACNGHEGVVKMLGGGRDDVDSGKPENRGRMPLGGLSGEGTRKW